MLYLVLALISFVVNTHQRPPQAMFHSARPVFLGLNLPQFFETNAVALCFTVFAQVESVVELLCQMSVAALRENRAFRMQLHTALECILPNLGFFIYQYYVLA